MKELTDLIAAWRALPPDMPAVLATVIETAGSTYRRPGARMLLTLSGWVAGSISGGCLESDLVDSAFRRTADGPSIVTYDATADDDVVWGFGLGCNGMVRVYLERLPPDGGVLAEIERAFAERRPTSITAGEFVEVIRPPRLLAIFGGGHDVDPLVRSAKALGWYVVVTDPRPTYADPARFAAADCVVATSPSQAVAGLRLDEHSAVVIMGHHYLNDLAALREVLHSPVGYIGLLGPVRRAEKMRLDLLREGISATPQQRDAIHAPVGLDIGAEGPDEIALAILAEIQAFFRGRSGGSLRERPDPEVWDGRLICGVKAYNPSGGDPCSRSA